MFRSIPAIISLDIIRFSELFGVIMIGIILDALMSKY